MSKQATKRSKTKREDSDSEDSDNLQPIHFFVPGEQIDAEVLVYFLTRYVDTTAKITSSRHPTDKSRTGFNVTAKKTLNATSLRDLINDSKDWDLESQGKAFRKRPYRYADSDTAKRRDRQGASKGGAVRPARQQREASLEAPAKGLYTSNKSPAPGNVSAATYRHFPPPPDPDGQRPAASYYASSSNPEAGGGMQSMYNPAHVATAQYTTSASHFASNINAYQGSLFPAQSAQISKYSTDQPPPYEDPTSRGRPDPAPPTHPDPDASFAGAKRIGSSQPMDTSTSRQRSLMPAEEQNSRMYSSDYRPDEKTQGRGQQRRDLY